jgi:hypothetical protein
MPFRVPSCDAADPEQYPILGIFSALRTGEEEQCFPPYVPRFTLETNSGASVPASELIAV